MCGRYSLAGPNPAQVRALYPVGEAVEVCRRYNVAPGDGVLAVTTGRDEQPRGELLRWGLVPPWASSPEGAANRINARVETVAERPTFRAAYARMRCLILADGFYEWRRGADGRKRAFHITARGRAVFAFAGLWSVWHGTGDQALRTCTILTRAANAAVQPLHDRMPIILSRGAEAAWLDSSTPVAALPELLAGISADDTEVRPVGPAVNDARYDGPECLSAPVEAQAALF